MNLRTIFLLLFFVFGCTLFAQQWTEPIELAPGTTPDFDVDPETGNIHLVYHTSGVVYAVISPDGEVLESESIPAAELDNPANGYRYGATVAFDPVTKRPHVCYRRGYPNWHFEIYYTYKKEDGSWSNSKRLIEKNHRAYLVRMDVDSQGRAHIVTGQSDTDDDLYGHAEYFRINGDEIEVHHNNLTKYRADDRLEIELGPNDEVNILLSSPDFSVDKVPGGLVSYWQSFDGGTTLERYGSLHAPEATHRNGNADIYADRSGDVHAVYGAREDGALDGDHSLRYVRIENGVEAFQNIVTEKGEIGEWQHSLGKGSVAANDNGDAVVVVYNQADNAQLRSRISMDNGMTWSEYSVIAATSGGADGREKECFKAWKNTFYLIYPIYGEAIYFTKLELPGPVAKVTGSFSATEGETLTFDASASTSREGESIVAYHWDWNNDMIPDTTLASATVQHTFLDDFAGPVILQVEDTQGLTDTTHVPVTIQNALPQLIVQSPQRATIDVTSTLSADVTDPGVEDTHTFKWDLNGDGVFERDGQQIDVVFSEPGEVAVNVQVSDDDGGVATEQITVIVGNGIPQITGLTGQSIDEGQLFDSINLNEYVTDPDDPVSSISWQISGNSELIISILENMAVIALPDSEWSGSENLLFTASDPDGNSDTTTVTFQVFPINDAPIIKPMGNQEFTNDSELLLDFSTFIHDPDDATEQVVLESNGSLNLNVTVDGLIATISPYEDNWIGSELVTFSVTDPAGLSTSSVILFIVRTGTGVSEHQIDVPTETKLYANYPNPFNPETTITFDLTEHSRVTVDIFNVSGRLVSRLAEQDFHAGNHKLVWQAKAVSSGTYILNIRVDGQSGEHYTAQKKMLLLR